MYTLSSLYRLDGKGGLEEFRNFFRQSGRGMFTRPLFTRLASFKEGRYIEATIYLLPSFKDSFSMSSALQLFVAHPLDESFAHGQAALRQGIDPFLAFACMPRR